MPAQFPLREAPAGNMVVVFIKTDIQSKMMDKPTIYKERTQGEVKKTRIIVTNFDQQILIAAINTV